MSHALLAFEVFVVFVTLAAWTLLFWLTWHKALEPSGRCWRPYDQEVDGDEVEPPSAREEFRREAGEAGAFFLWRLRDHFNPRLLPELDGFSILALGIVVGVRFDGWPLHWLVGIILIVPFALRMVFGWHDYFRST
jgi:hypothetical protein